MRGFFHGGGVIRSMTSDNDDKEAENRARRQRKEGERSETGETLDPRVPRGRGRKRKWERDRQERGKNTREVFFRALLVFTTKTNRPLKIPIMMLGKS